MALNSSGPISLGGATTGQSINLELGQSATATTSLNATNVRTLAGKASGAITMPTDFWGKSSASYWWSAIGSNVTYCCCCETLQGSQGNFFTNGFILGGNYFNNIKLLNNGLSYGTQIRQYSTDGSSTIKYTSNSNVTGYLINDIRTAIGYVVYASLTEANTIIGLFGTSTTGSQPVKINLATGVATWLRNGTPSSTQLQIQGSTPVPGPNGNMAAGSAAQTSSTQGRLGFFIIDSSGNQIVAYRYTGGDLASTGTSFNASNNVDYDNSNNWYQSGQLQLSPKIIPLIKYNSSGTVQWAKKIAYNTASGSSGMICTNKSTGDIFTICNGQIIKISTGGSLLWSYLVRRSGADAVSFSAMSYDETSGYLLVNLVYNTGIPFTLYVLWIDGATGSLVRARKCSTYFQNSNYFPLRFGSSIMLTTWNPSVSGAVSPYYVSQLFSVPFDGSQTKTSGYLSSINYSDGASDLTLTSQTPTITTLAYTSTATTIGGTAGGSVTYTTASNTFSPDTYGTW